MAEMTNEEVIAAFEKVGGSAFPSSRTLPEGGELSCPGMSLRDWFAGQALCGMSVNAEASSVEAVPDLMLTVADLAYKMADAMIAERSKP